jgi:hypothetical protein
MDACALVDRNGSAGTELAVKFDGALLLDGLTEHEARMGSLMLPVRLAFRRGTCVPTRLATTAAL